MKKNAILSILSVFLLCSCLDKKQVKEGETPEALQNDGSSGLLLSKRGYTDLVDELYTEIVKNSPQLTELETKINVLEKSESDSTKNFHAFNQKNIQYYSSINGKVNQIKDSVLKEKIKLIVKESLSKYDKNMLKQKGLLSQIEKNKVTLNDLHLVLKITKTLYVMEKYQSINKPSSKSINGFIKEQNATITLADTLTKR